MIKLVYSVFALPENKYLFKYSLTSLNVPAIVVMEMSSFGITCEPEEFLSKTGERLRAILEEKWLSDEVPYFFFNYVGFTAPLDKLPTSMYVHFKRKSDTEESNYQWFKYNCTKTKDTSFTDAVLYLSPTEILTSDPAIRSWFKNPIPAITPTSKPLLTTVHKSWYPDAALRNALMKMGLLAIEHFLVAKELDMYIPAYSVVPVYHIRHFRRAYQILTDQYHPKFIMTLPIRKDKMFTPYYESCSLSAKNQYTVLFPILKDLPKR